MGLSIKCAPNTKKYIKKYGGVTDVKLMTLVAPLEIILNYGYLVFSFFGKREALFYQSTHFRSHACPRPFHQISFKS
jgi:hypothetical protein